MDEKKITITLTISGWPDDMEDQCQNLSALEGQLFPLPRGGEVVGIEVEEE